MAADNMPGERLSREEHDNAFGCPICLGPKSRMVYGICQHSVCRDCLYGDNSLIAYAFLSCPLCHLQHAFPVLRPAIPDTNIKLLRAVGVTECPNPGCGEETWQWEMETHLLKCKKSPKTKKKGKRSRTRSQPVVPEPSGESDSSWSGAPYYELPKTRKKRSKSGPDPSTSSSGRPRRRGADRHVSRPEPGGEGEESVGDRRRASSGSQAPPDKVYHLRRRRKPVYT